MHSLNGLNVLVTRAEQQAQSLISDIEALKGNVIFYPMIEIQRLSNPQKALNTIEGLDQYSQIIFISANAVIHGLRVLPNLPSRLNISAVGKQTQHTLNQHGYFNVNCPEDDFSSLGLLNTPLLNQVNSQKILIVRGTSGKETLRDTLVKRGAIVDYLACYSVVRPNYSTVEIKQLIVQFNQNKIDIITASSIVSIENLKHLIQSDVLLTTPLLPISVNMSDKAKKMGFKQVLPPAKNASNAAILSSLTQFKTEKSN